MMGGLSWVEVCVYMAWVYGVAFGGVKCIYNEVGIVSCVCILVAYFIDELV